MKKLFFAAAALLLFSPALHAEEGGSQHLMWIDNNKSTPDTHVAFRGKISLDYMAELDLQISGASWYGIWIDGEYFTEGPDRYTAQYPEYQSRKVVLDRGTHIIAVQVHYEGVVTRMLDDIEPFLCFRAELDGREIPVEWKCEALRGYASQMRRINPQLGWIEWVDTRQRQENWQQYGYDDSAWMTPVEVERPLGEFTQSKINPVKSLPVEARIIASGDLAEVFGYPGDNPGASFFLRELSSDRYPAQGVWRRYDLGRVRLSRPKLVLDLPAGATVEIAYSEQLSGGRVAPWITLSAGDSYNIDHYIARGGEQEFSPLTPKGGRFVEVHILAPKDQIRFVSEQFIERCYYDTVDGAFDTDDDLLDRIWQTGIETYKACSEDALVDNPTRERGQWMGDVGLVGMEIGAAGFSDIAIVRRGLLQMAQCANPEGLVAGLCPGGESYMASYALQWIPSCMSYWELTGDRSLLEEVYGAAQSNVAVFDNYITEEGIAKECPYWNFIDWGYVSNDGPSDMALNLHYMIAVQTMTRWATEMGDKAKSDLYRRKADDFRRILDHYYQSLGYDWDAIGYHRTVLGMRAGLVPERQIHAAVALIKKHILSCFPNDPDAPRLSDPGANNPRLITPYFAHYAFPVLIDNGEIDFVLDQYRTCWGWALEGGRTTWVEVFDTRWTHCHQWGGAPTWQLSRYVLGLTPRLDRKEGSFNLTLTPGSLERASGRIPLPSGKTIEVKWERGAKGISYEILSPEPLEITRPEGGKPIVVKANERKVINI